MREGRASACAPPGMWAPPWCTPVLLLDAGAGECAGHGFGDCGGGAGLRLLSGGDLGGQFGGLRVISRATWRALIAVTPIDGVCTWVPSGRAA
ncbi:hypothetical protein GCM10010478_16760 [Streptomyces erythrogriseus]|uniref:Uncharacterized protein n=1 Tax=Streptomyces erythrogriseus TaxID=284027 RepID=A0ABN3WK09_9ACTN